MFTDTSVEFARDRSFGRGLDGMWPYGDLASCSLKRGLLMHVLALRPLGGRPLRFRIGEQLAVNGGTSWMQRAFRGDNCPDQRVSACRRQ
jgi:hypothetical protein